MGVTSCPRLGSSCGEWGVGRRGRCGQDFLEKGDPGVWGRKVTLGLKPGCCQTHNSRETQHRPTTGLRPQLRDTNRYPTQFHCRTQGKCHRHATRALPGSVCASTGTKDSGAHNRHVTQAGTLGYTPETVQTHPDTGGQTRPGSAWTHKMCLAGAHRYSDRHGTHR